jgi:ATP-dependent protease ClpP protease subunit
MIRKIITVLLFSVFLLVSYTANSRTIYQPDHVAKFRIEKDEGIINLQGEINEDSSTQVQEAFEYFKDNNITHVLIHLHSLGGNMKAGSDIVEEVINARKNKVWVAMLVDHGEYCASMCTGIFAVGSSRMSAGDTTWMFHSPYVKMTDEEKNDPVKRKELEDMIDADRGWLIQVYSLADKKWTKNVLKKYIMDEKNGQLILSGEDILKQSDTWFTGVLGD